MHNVFIGRATKPTLSLYERLACRLHESRIHVPIAATCDLRRSWVPKSGRIIDDKAKAVRVVERGSNLDPNVRRVMPEEEPANHSEYKVDTKQSISLIFDNIDYILLLF